MGKRLIVRFWYCGQVPPQGGLASPSFMGLGFYKQAQVWKLVKKPYFSVAMIHSNFSFFYNFSTCPVLNKNLVGFLYISLMRTPWLITHYWGSTRPIRPLGKMLWLWCLLYKHAYLDFDSWVLALGLCYSGSCFESFRLGYIVEHPWLPF